MKRWTAPLLVAGLFFAACGDDDGGGSSTTPSTADAAPSSTAETSATAEPTGTDPATTDGETDTTGADSTPADTTSATDASTGPITIEHSFGETTIEARPERIVSLDNQWTDVLTALDGPLVAAALDPLVDGGRFPWQTDIPATVEDIPVTGDSIPFEAIAAAQPDLIVVTYTVVDAADYDTLSEIAPVIPLLGDEAVDTWQDIAVAAGEILGIEDEAAALIADTEQISADLVADLPGLEGTTYAFANYVPGDAIYVVVELGEGAGVVFSQLGLEMDPDLPELPNVELGRAKLSLERVNELDAELLLLLTNGAEPADIAGYDLLPAVQTDAVAILDMNSAVALNTPSPLSVPWALDTIRPALEAAAAS